uniref:Uncharacterized protein n=2 Tax=Aegilops tauschii subsp. strangulata TaxID=200361 RepID=A0A453N7B5_AEGTS
CTEEEEDELLERRRMRSCWRGSAAEEGADLLEERSQRRRRRCVWIGGCFSLSFPSLTCWRQQHLCFPPEDCFLTKTTSLPGWQAQGVQYGPRCQPGRLSSASDALKLKADALLRYLRQAGRLELARCPDA